MNNKKICCISSECDLPFASKIINAINSHYGLGLFVLKENQPVTDFEEVILIISLRSVRDEYLKKRIKEASNLNKSFYPVVVGGNWFKNWLFKIKYQGGNLRTDFLFFNKNIDQSQFFSSIGNHIGWNVCGDIYGAFINVRVNLDCQLYRGDEVIVKTNADSNARFFLCKGSHTIKFQSVSYPLLNEVRVINVKDNDQTIELNIDLIKPVLVANVSIDGGTYSGTILLDKRDGKGTFVYTDGTVYKGEWKNDMRSGFGKQTWSESCYYIGDWKNDDISGKGEYYEDGTKYVGEWLSNKFNGYGKLYRNKRKLEYQGNWRNGKKHGLGKMWFETGEVYDGNWVSDRIEGKGKMVYSDRTKYEGNWVNGQRHGNGRLYNSRGVMLFDGEWEYDTQKNFGGKIMTKLRSFWYG